jgi:hypothetical protein
MNSAVLSMFIAFFIAEISADKTAFDGKCPEVSFVKDFDSTKFFGKWFAVKETGREIPCIYYNWEETRPNHFHGYVLPHNKTIEFDKVNAESFSEGLKVEFEPNVDINGGIFKVFATDYGELREKLLQTGEESQKTRSFLIQYHTEIFSLTCWFFFFI